MIALSIYIYVYRERETEQKKEREGEPESKVSGTAKEAPKADGLASWCALLADDLGSKM